MLTSPVAAIFRRLPCLILTVVTAIGTGVVDTAFAQKISDPFASEAEESWGVELPSAPRGGQPASFLDSEPQNRAFDFDAPMVMPETLEDGLSQPEAVAAVPPPIVPYGTTFSLSWTSGSGDGLGVTDAEVRQTLVFPRIPGFMVSVGSAVHFLSGPETTDLPETLYDHSLEFRWMKPIKENWVLDLAISPSFYTDYDNTSSDALRIPGRALAIWNKSKEWQFLFGLLYLDREDIAALPAAGAIWSPNDDYKVEVLFPRPRVMRRLSTTGDRTSWVYLGGEFGGGSWAIDRANQTPDVVTYSALRLLVGYEVKIAGHNGRPPSGLAPRVEAGYVFSRKIEYRSNLGNYDPDSAFLLRAGASF